ncbi:histidinol-phosphate transaminase [Chloroflexota bacterium]
MTKLIRRDIRNLGGYTAHKSPDTLDKIPASGVIKLDANENPYGCSPKAIKALADYKDWQVYPDAGQVRLRRSLQGYTGIDAGFIVAATGSGELLDDLLCLLLEPGDEVINCTPTFDLYRFRTMINDGRLVDVPRRDDYSVDVGAVKLAISARTKLIVLANPNNPTGNTVPQKDILELAETGMPLLIDEAYYEFCGETVAPLTAKYANLMVLRTFSKWAGLAGLRLGYGIFPAEIAAYLLKIKLPYNVNAAAVIAAQASLEDVAYLTENVKAIIGERERLFGELSKLAWLKPFPSQANYILCLLKKGSAGKLHLKLQEKGILVRYFDQPRLQNCIRVSAGKPEQTDALMKVLRDLEEEING